MVVKYPCGICSKSVAKTHKGIFCDICLTWVHIKCNNTSKDEYVKLSESNKDWFCQKCFNGEVPFYSITDEDLKLSL